MIRMFVATLAVAASAILVVLGVDILRTPERIAADDLRFASAPHRQRSLWTGAETLPGRPVARVLATDDDLAYRRAVWLFARVVRGNIQRTTPELEALRGSVVLELSERSREERDPVRRAQLLNAAGVFSLSRFSSFAPEQERTLRVALDTFRNAVRLDPENADARANLELVLRAADAANLPGEDPEAGSAGGTGAGQSSPGSGY